MDRRTFLAGSAAALAAPSVSRAQSTQTLRFIPQADLAILDPVVTSIYVTRNHGYMVFDTLYGMDGSFTPSPQMVEGHVIGDDGRSWTLTLREGLFWHDGERVLARDCVASIRRWARKDALGEALMRVTDALSAPDDRTILFRLSKPFPLLPYALGKLAAPMCAMMPERLANTDPAKPIVEMVGSGPYRFKADERIQGARNVYERFDAYRPRPSGAPDWTAGSKVAHFNRVEWTTIPDAATAAAALQTGAQDWWENANFDLLPVLKGNRNIKIGVPDKTGWIGVMRPNHVQPPFNNPAIRRAVLRALDQESFMQAIVGDDRSSYRTNVGIFCPDTPMASEAGLDILKAPRDIERARREIIEAGYKGEKVVVLIPSDFPAINAMGLVAADLMQKIGLNTEAVATDWGSMIQRRSNAGPVDKGGWSIFFTAVVGSDILNPAAHFILRGNGRSAWPGWPDSPRIEELRQAWFEAPTEEAQRAVCMDLQRQCMTEVPYYPLGQYAQPTAYRSDLTGMLDGFATFWNLRRS